MKTASMQSGWPGCGTRAVPRRHVRVRFARAPVRTLPLLASLGATNALPGSIMSLSASPEALGRRAACPVDVAVVQKAR